jgi:hypothetical protein
MGKSLVKGIPTMTRTVLPEELRVCSDCAKIKPLTLFRRRFRDREDRMYQCSQCHAAAERRRRKHHRSIRTGQRMQALATAMKTKSRSTQQLATLREVSIVAAGGFEALLRDWHDVFQQCLANGKPTPRLVAFYEGILGLISRSRKT